MTLTLDIDGLTTAITTIAGNISGIRRAYNYNEWPSRPPGAPNKDNAYHLTGMPGTDGTGVQYGMIGMDLSEYIIGVPLYAIVLGLDGLTRDRSASWISPYYGRYPEMFRDHAQLTVNSVPAIASGIAQFETPAQVTRSIPDYPGFDGFFIVRWTLMCHIKGAHTNSP